MNDELFSKNEPVEVEEEEKKTNWKFIIIFSAIYCVIGVGTSFLVSAIVGDFQYTEIITAIFGVLILLFMMIRIWFRGSHNLKKDDRSVVEDKESLSYKNWFRLQMCFLFVGLFLILLSQLFFIIFIYAAK